MIFLQGLGFMFGVLVAYTIYDAVFTFIARRNEREEAKKRKRRHH